MSKKGQWGLDDINDVGAEDYHELAKRGQYAIDDFGAGVSQELISVVHIWLRCCRY